MTSISMKILAVQPQNCFHWTFDNSVIEALRDIGSVTVAAPKEYKLEMKGVERINLPTAIHASRLVGYWAQLLICCEVSRIARAGDYDCVVFLSFDSVGILAYRAPLPGVLFDHNNASRLLNKKWGHAIYRAISRRLLLTTLSRGAEEQFRRLSLRPVAYIRHPVNYFFKKIVMARDASNQTAALIKRAAGRVIIFSPSGGLSKENFAKLLQLARGSDSRFFLIVKYQKTLAEDGMHSAPYFSDYSELMQAADLVLNINEYVNRASGVVYEALSCRKMVLLINSDFAINLKSAYPSLIKIVNPDTLEEDLMMIDYKIEKEDYQRFIVDHGRHATSSSIVNLLSRVLDCSSERRR